MTEYGIFKSKVHAKKSYPTVVCTLVNNCKKGVTETHEVPNVLVAAYTFLLHPNTNAACSNTIY